MKSEENRQRGLMMEVVHGRVLFNIKGLLRETISPNKDLVKIDTFVIKCKSFFTNNFTNILFLELKDMYISLSLYIFMYI